MSEPYANAHLGKWTLAGSAGLQQQTPSLCILGIHENRADAHINRGRTCCHYPIPFQRIIQEAEAFPYKQRLTADSDYMLQQSLECHEWVRLWGMIIIILCNSPPLRHQCLASPLSISVKFRDWCWPCWISKRCQISVPRLGLAQPHYPETAGSHNLGNL